MSIRAFVALAALAGCVQSAPPGAVTYMCADGTRISAIYGHEGEDDTATLVLNGETALLLSEPAASGVRYGWPSDGSSYVWWTKGKTATLSWKDGEKGGTETVLHAGCVQQ